MRARPRVFGGCLALGMAIALGPIPRVRADVAYTVTDLGPAVGSSSATGINAAGQVSGSLDSGGLLTHAFISSNGTLTDLGSLPNGGASHGTAINTQGVVVGDSQVVVAGLIRTHAVAASASQPMQDLGTLSGGTDSFATGVNASQQISGFGNTANGYIHAFLIGPTGTINDLSTLNGADANSRAYGINGVGQVVGASETAGGTTHAFIGTPGNLIDLGGLANGNDSSVGLAINDLGRAVGFAGIQGSTHAFRTTPNNTLEDLGVLAGTVSSRANAINNFNIVVGSSQFGSGLSHAFIYDDSLPVKMVDLNALISPAAGWVLNSATGINDAGQIVGTGINGSGQTHAFLLTPTAVPEPSVLVLATLGLGLLVGGRRFRGWVTRERTGGPASVAPAAASPER